MQFADLIIGAVLVFLFLLAVTMFVQLFLLRVPYVPTRSKVAEAMVRLAELKPGDIVYDLGAGDGRLLLHATSLRPDITAIGYEIVPTVWFWGWLRSKVARSKVRMVLGDALQADLRDASVIFLYLMPHLMQTLEEKFDRELRPGTRVISNKFTFPGRTPAKVVEVPHISWGGKKVHVYEW
jgi:SAM-dependent methyltransferase